jgi:hypothetical protein
MTQDNSSSDFSSSEDLEEMEFEVSQLHESNNQKTDTEESPRDGLYWVRRHSHEVLAVGDVPSPEPENSGVVQRRYFATFEKALDGWGRFTGNKHKVKKAQEIVKQMCDLESTEPHEFFFTVPSGSYLAVVMKNSGHSGRVWLRKTTIHTARKVDATTPIKNKSYFECTLPDYIDGVSAGSKGVVAKRPVCKFSYIQVPLSGKCECGHPDCEFAPPS